MIRKIALCCCYCTTSVGFMVGRAQLASLYPSACSSVLALKTSTLSKKRISANASRGFSILASGGSFIQPVQKSNGSIRGRPTNYQKHEVRGMFYSTDSDSKYGEDSGSNNSKMMQDILYRVRDTNYMPREVKTSLLEFRIDGLCVGKVRPNIAGLLSGISSGPGLAAVFEIQSDDDGGGVPYLTLNEKTAGTSFESRTQAVAEVMNQLREDGVVSGWRDELYPVTTGFYDPPLFVMERAAVSMLGALEYGVHINGLVRDKETGDTKMWMARRSADKSKYPGMLDHIVAGGQPVGVSLWDNVLKECLEEANIPNELVQLGRTCRPTGAVSYETYSSSKDTVSRAVLFNYDLYLPPDFVPTPVDGEVEEFFLWNMKDVLKSMARDYPDPIKPNCYIVIIDYLLREQGHLISPDTPGYLNVLRELRSGDCR